MRKLQLIISYAGYIAGIVTGIVSLANGDNLQASMWILLLSIFNLGWYIASKEE